MANPIPQELNWVEVRAACTVAQVLVDLMNGVEKDVAEANKAHGAIPEQPIFKVTVGVLDTQFGVQRRGRVKRVIFSRTDTHILIASDITDEKWEYTLGLNDEGRCLLRRDGLEFELWQVRRIALEGMFFGEQA